jgi:hypothetical protein
MPAGHLVTLGELALLRYADTHKLIDTRREVTMFFAIENPDVHHPAMFTVGQA